jgi:hypothetical protein
MGPFYFLGKFIKNIIGIVFFFIWSVDFYTLFTHKQSTELFWGHDLKFKMSAIFVVKIICM